MSGSLRVLLIDDNPHDRLLATRALRREFPDLRVQQVTEAQALARALEAGDFDLLITDYHIRWTDGLSVQHAVKARYPDCPVIMFTATGSEEVAVRAMKAGLDDYVVKSPQHFARLPAAARAALEKARQRRALQEAETRYQDLFEGVPVGLYRTTPEGQIVDANPAMVHMLGYPARESLLAVDAADLYANAADRRRWQALMERRGVVRHFEVQLRRHDGTVIWVENDARAICDAEDRVLCYEGSLEDITERKRAEERVRRQLEELVVLRAVATAGAEAVNEDTLIEHATRVIDRLLRADCFGVWLLDEAAAVLHAHPSYRGCQEGVAVPLGHGIVGQVALNAQPRRIPDLARLDEPSARRTCPCPRLRSMLCVPLRADGQVSGVFNAASTQRDAFGGADERLLVTFASQLATAIEKLRLMEALKRRVADRTRELAALYDVTAIANEFLDLNAVLERSLERVLAAIGGHIGIIYLLDEARETLHVAAQQGVPPDLVTHVDAIAVGSGLAGWVIEHNKPLAAPDVATDPRAFRMVHMGHHHAYVGAPLQVRGQTLGVISVLREPQQPLNVEDVALLTAIADHVGVVVENVRLHRRAEQAAVRVERERLARELHDSVTQSLYSLILFAGAGRDATGSGGLELVAQHLVRIEEIAQQALKEMRLLVYELRPLALEQEGLVEALRHRLEAVEGRTGVEAHLLAEQDIELVAPVEDTLYYVAQEALNNALKHAAANSVTVRVAAQDGRVALEVLDDGLGFDPESVRHGGGLGLIGMRERVKELGGSLQVISAPGQGTRVCVTLGCQEVSR